MPRAEGQRERQQGADVGAVRGNHREAVARGDSLAAGRAPRREHRGGPERGRRVPVVGVHAEPPARRPRRRRLDAGAPRIPDVLEVPGGRRGSDEEDVVTHVGAIQIRPQRELALRTTKVPAQLISGRDHGAQGRIGTQRERQRARGGGIATRDLHQRRRAEAGAPGGVHLVPRSAGPRQRGPGAQPVEHVEPALRGIEQVVVRQTDIVVSPHDGGGERRRHIPARARESAEVDLVGADRIGERVGSSGGRGVEPYDGVRVLAVEPRKPAQRATQETRSAGELERAAGDALVIALP